MYVCTSGIYWVEAEMLLNILNRMFPRASSYPAPTVSNAEVQHPALQEGCWGGGGGSTFTLMCLEKES